MQQKKSSAKLQKAPSLAGRKALRKAGDNNGARSTAASKSSRNGSKKLSADDLLLRVWQKIYEDHHPTKKVKSK